MKTLEIPKRQKGAGEREKEREREIFLKKPLYLHLTADLIVQDWVLSSSAQEQDKNILSSLLFTVVEFLDNATLQKKKRDRRHTDDQWKN